MGDFMALKESALVGQEAGATSNNEKVSYHSNVSPGWQECEEFAWGHKLKINFYKSDYKIERYSLSFKASNEMLKWECNDV